VDRIRTESKSSGASGSGVGALAAAHEGMYGEHFSMPEIDITWKKAYANEAATTGYVLKK
jgi:hypothetical protein